MAAISCYQCDHPDSKGMHTRAREDKTDLWQQSAERFVKLLLEVRAGHRDPESADYNGCEKSPCRWCEEVQEALEKAKLSEAKSDSPVLLSVRESLSEYAHEAWSGWVKYMFSKMTLNDDGTATMPKWAVERWTR